MKLKFNFNVIISLFMYSNIVLYNQSPLLYICVLALTSLVVTLTICQQTHNNGGEFQCDQCNYRCNRRSKMTQHQARHSQKLLCHQCTATFVDMSSLNRHVMCKHTGTSNFILHV